MASLDQIAWCRLNDEDVQFTIIPEKGSQLWSVLRIDTVFEQYTIASAAPKNTINLEVPIQALQRALKSALGATEVSIRLTKKDNVPILCLTIVTNTFTTGNSVVTSGANPAISDEFGDFDFDVDLTDPAFGGSGQIARERSTVVTQDIPVKVLALHTVEGLHEPKCPEPDVHITLPNLAQVKSISDRFTRLALATKTSSSTASSTSTTPAPRLSLSANMHGSFKIAITSDALSISSVWKNLNNPELDPSQYEDGSQSIRDHPSTKMKELGGPNGENEEGWAHVKIDAKDWSRILSVGRLNSRVIACFIKDTALILYVYLPNEDDGGDESCMTVSFVSSFPFLLMRDDVVLTCMGEFSTTLLRSVLRLRLSCKEWICGWVLIRT